MPGTSSDDGAGGAKGFLLHPGEDDREERTALLQHLRDAHPNLFGPGGPEAGMGFSSPLPNSGASDLPLAYLAAIHDASHLGLYRDHLYDDWQVRRTGNEANTG